jgi:hypothetical protein
MKLEWFRQHKNFVYWILLPVVGGTMAFFGVGKAGSGGGGAHPGRSASYTVDGRSVAMSPAEVFERRVELTHYIPQSGRTYNMPDGRQEVRDVSTFEAARFEMQYQTAKAAGFELGEQDLKAALQANVKGQISARSSGEKHEASTENYNKLLADMQLTGAQFERLAHQQQVAGRYENFLNDVPPVIDGKLFIEYMREKESARLRYVEVKSEDYLKDAKDPAEAKIKEFHDKHKSVIEAGGRNIKTQEDWMRFSESMKYNDVFKTEAALSAEVMCFNPAKLIAEIKPTAEELNAFYEKTKQVTTTWQEKADPATPTAGIKYKPFDAVKKEVEEAWLKGNIPLRIDEKAKKLNQELSTALDIYNSTQKIVPDALKKKFDVAQWAKAQGLDYWVTGMKTQSEFSKGKKELNAQDAAWAANLFRLEGMPARALDHFEQYEFDTANREKGAVLARRNEHTPSRMRTLEEAKAGIVEQLKIEQAGKLAKEAADKLRDQWAKGENLPAIDSMEEVSGSLDSITSEDKNPNELLSAYLNGAHEAIGEPLPVVKGSIKTKPDEKPSKHTVYHVGFAVERATPSWDKFEKDTVWADKKAKDATSKIERSEGGFLASALHRQLISGIQETSAPELPVYAAYQNSEE